MTVLKVLWIYFGQIGILVFLFSRFWAILGRVTKPFANDVLRFIFAFGRAYILASIVTTFALTTSKLGFNLLALGIIGAVILFLELESAAEALRNGFGGKTNPQARQVYSYYLMFAIVSSLIVIAGIYYNSIVVNFFSLWFTSVVVKIQFHHYIGEVVTAIAAIYCIFNMIIRELLFVVIRMLRPNL